MKTIKILIAAICIGTGSIIAITGCAGDRYHESTGESIDDTSTTSRVKEALSHSSDYKFNDVKVTTFKGTVQLSGFVETRAQKSQAGDIAKNVQGAKNVVDNITVKE